MTRIRYICELVPGNYFFTINAAGIVGYDLAAQEQGENTQALVQEAIQLLEDGLQQKPEDPFFHYELGKLYLLKIKDAEVAKQHFEKAAGSQ